jgi:nucleoside-diphosphate-sugar epimerase
MARKPVVLGTGASGEIGHGLIHEIAERGTLDILALDVRPLDPDLARRCAAVRIGDILDRHLLDRVRAEFEISAVFHLAALLSTRAEFVPESAHEINIQGTLNLLHLSVEEARALGHPVKFLFPSSIAVYGLPDIVTKRAAGRSPRTPGSPRSPSTAVPSSTASISAGTSRATTVSSPRRARAVSTSGRSASPACSPPSPRRAGERATMRRR